MNWRLGSSMRRMASSWSVGGVVVAAMLRLLDDRLCPLKSYSAADVDFVVEAGDGRAVVCTMGDGATSKGDVYEAVNVAGAWRLPLLSPGASAVTSISAPGRLEEGERKSHGSLSFFPLGCGHYGTAFTSATGPPRATTYGSATMPQASITSSESPKLYSAVNYIEEEGARRMS